MRNKYYDPEGWKLCTLRYNVELGRGLWLLCGACRKSRYFDTAEWAKKHNIDLDTPFKTLGKAIPCHRCGTRGVSAHAEPYRNSDSQPARRFADGPICPECGWDDVHVWPLRFSDYPPGFKRKFARNRMMETCGCEQCDNWWTQPTGLRIQRCPR